MKSNPLLHFWILAGLMFSLTYGETTFAASSELILKNENVYLSDATPIHNQVIRIYASVENVGNEDVLGSIQFKNQTTGNPIGSDQPVSVLKGRTDTVFVDWRPPAGIYTLSVTVIPWDDSQDDPSNNTVTFTVNVEYDYDSDGIGNSQDADDDNDTVKDTEDAFPLNSDETKDTDGDGTGNNTDEDDDDDGTPDANDSLPENAEESIDTDEDGIGDNEDEDDDDDGLSDEEEISGTMSSNTGNSNENSETNTSGDSGTTDSTELNPSDTSSGSASGSTSESSNPSETTPSVPTDPKDPDTDDDTYKDGEDAFPLDDEEWRDHDGDAIGDNEDPDDDNDEIADETDTHPYNKGPVVKVQRYEENDPETGEKTIVFDATETMDPDGNRSNLHFQWYTKEGRLLGEKTLLRINLPLGNIFPSTLKVWDEEGEERSYDLSLKTKTLLKIMGGSLAMALGLALAWLLFFKYTAPAKGPSRRQKKPRQTSKKSKP